MNPLRLGYLYGIGAYLLWGFFPLYFKLLRPSGPMEILAQRVVWSLAFVALLLAALRNWGFLRELRHRRSTMAGIGVAALLIAGNWGTYIYGVNADRVVETALGYFITPLVSVLLGVAVLKERLRPTQWAALAVGTLAVAVLTVDYGHLPYLALLLAVTFSGYGLVKKRLGLPAAEGLFAESAVLAVPALGYLGWLTWQAEATFGQVSAGHTALLVLAGAATAIPLLLFAGAANRLPLSVLGLLQYLAPVLQLGCGVLVFHEPMPPARLAGFALVWLALAIFTVDALRVTGRRRREIRKEGPPLIASGIGRAPS
ncbi:EamA family transporter RarD [Micromonospora sp. CPCC 206060]|uniref:EamA family transporter RarD n=1 Tax=Micromonospora sp. CPCC 206060 TaxID=3122406 RepID=UPI002FF2E71B